ncbi:MAG: hypothetical protein C4331_16880 [Meiothermus sp.]
MVEEEEGVVQLKVSVRRDTQPNGMRYTVMEGGRERDFGSVLELAAYLEQLARPRERAGGLK